jgi:hypothetical protein
MTILISWSGKQSHAVAKALHEWISVVVPGSDPWMSSLDISPGDGWFPELMEKLEQTEFCIICLTPDNLRSPWLYFEAGAIAAKRKQAKVFGLLTGVSTSQLGPGPFTQFQCVEASSDGILMLVREINKALKERAHDDHSMEAAFADCWPKLREKLKAALLIYDPGATTAQIETDQMIPTYALTDEQQQLLLEAASDKQGTILMARTMHGLILQTNDKQLAEGQNARSEAKWQSAVRELLQQGLIESRGNKGEVFRVTAEGYRVADELNAARLAKA